MFVSRVKADGMARPSRFTGPWRCWARLGDAVRNGWAAKKDWGGRSRTSNLLVNSQALRQLSYTPMKNRPLGGSTGRAVAIKAKMRLHAHRPVP